ncbi:MAG: rhodanese-like domain-containing protein [Saprospiraceae bacterium]
MKIILIIFLVLIIFAYGWSSQSKNDNDQTRGYKNMDASDFEEFMQNNKTVLIDVRTPIEVAQGKIANALEINVMAGDFTAKVGKLSKDKTYLLYCRSGQRSAKACAIMNSQGFDQLINLKGGYKAWVKAHK